MAFWIRILRTAMSYLCQCNCERESVHCVESVDALCCCQPKSGPAAMERKSTFSTARADSAGAYIEPLLLHTRTLMKNDNHEVE